MDMSAVTRAIEACFPSLVSPTILSLGEGDYCRAYAVEGGWVFLFAKAPEASLSLERVAKLLPKLAPTLPLPVPRPEHFGYGDEDGLAYIGYRKIEGVELSAERFHALSAVERERCADDLAAYFRALHAFDPAAAREAGVPVCEYPFAAIEEGMRTGAAEEEYRRDLERLAGHGALEVAALRRLEAALAEHLESGPAQLALLHGEVSQDHVLVDPTANCVVGIIDFNGMIIGDPARDLLYLFEEYGEGFVLALLDRHPLGQREDVLSRLRFLHLWHIALRLLWALDHGYERRSKELSALLEGRSAGRR